MNQSISNGCLDTTGFYNDIDEIYTAGSALLCSEACPCAGHQGDFTDPYGAITLLECPGARQIYTPEIELKYGKWFNYFES